jgi:ribulose-phosphate 3-epimerase
MVQLNNKKPLISPSILASNFATLIGELPKIKDAGVDYIHYDVMDNHFVPQLTFGYKFVKDFNSKTDIISDVHLMIDNPHLCVDNYIEAGSNILTFHIESMPENEIKPLLLKVKSNNILCGLSIKPKTPVSSLLPYIDLLDLVLVMTVEPGFGGQKLIEECLPKIDELKKIIDEKNLGTVIQADGGINLSNAPELHKRGCTFFVMGSAFFKETDYNVFMAKFNKALT